MGVIMGYMNDWEAKLEAAKEKSYSLECDTIWNNWDRYFGTMFKRVDREHEVYGSLIQKAVKPWRIDYLADVGNREGDLKRYVVEKDLNESMDRWHCFKIFGYQAAYVIDRGESMRRIGGMVFHDQRVICHRMRNILALS